MRNTWGSKERGEKHGAVYHQSGITVVTRKATWRERGGRERASTAEKDKTYVGTRREVKKGCRSGNATSNIERER